MSFVLITLPLLASIDLFRLGGWLPHLRPSEDTIDTQIVVWL